MGWIAGWLCNKPQAPKPKKLVLLYNEECLFHDVNKLCFRVRDNPIQWLITIFDHWWIVLLITLIFTGIVSYFLKEPEVNLQLNLQNIVSKLDALTKEVAEIKKVIEEIKLKIRAFQAVTTRAGLPRQVHIEILMIQAKGIKNHFVSGSPLLLSESIFCKKLRNHCRRYFHHFVCF